MNRHTESTTPRGPRQPYTLYVQQDRLFARNSDGSLIELGPVDARGDTLAYTLDGEKVAGSGFGDAAALLADLEGKLDFLFLDGQFTALPDLGDTVDLEGATRREITLEEFSADDGADPLAQRSLAGGMDEAHTTLPAGPLR